MMWVGETHRQLITSTHVTDRPGGRAGGPSGPDGDPVEPLGDERSH